MPTDHIVTEAVAVLLDADSDQLAATTPLEGIEGWDSVNALRLLQYLERQVNAQLDFERFHAATTLADVAVVVDQARAQKGTVR